MTVDDAVVELGGLRQRSVLALLLMARGSVLTNDAIVDALWGDEPPATASKTVQVYVSRLRAMLGRHADRLVSDPTGYRLVVADEELDAARFETALTRARGLVEQADQAFAVSVLDDALALRRGPALTDFAYEPFAATEIERLEELSLQATELRFASIIEAGSEDRTLADLRVAVSEHPYREGLWHSLALGLYRTGRQADALEALHAIRRLLRDELGIDPEPGLQRLEVAILNQEPTLAARPRNPLAGIRVQPGLTRLIGREREMAELSSLLAEHRLITITGPGGTGKTTVSQAVALSEAANHPDGAYFVDLSPIRDAGLVASSIASGLGISPGAGATPEAAVEDALRDRRALIVIDNFEQVREAAETVGRLVAAGPHLRVIVTSRVPLRIRGEREYALKPLSVVRTEPTPENVAGSPAVQLLIDRAASGGAHVEVTPANAALLAAICGRLDGLPLAIELAAARVRTLSFEEILARLDHSLTFLGGGPRDLPDRQRTLRATLDWSHELLTEAEARLLRRLSVFAGGFSLVAAESVCAGTPEPVVDTVASLVDHQLVRRDENVDASRFTMLETIRDYAAERLEASGESDATRRAHAEFFTALAERADVAMRGGGQREALAVLSAERENVRRALRWALDAGAAEIGIRLAGSMRVWWERHGVAAEGLMWLDAVLELPGPCPDDLRGRALSQSGALAFRLGDHRRSRERHTRALEIRRRMGDVVGIAKTLNNLALVADELGEYDAARGLMNQSVAAWRESGDPWGLAIVLGNTGAMLASQRLLEEAADALTESINLARTNDDGVALAMGLSELGMVWVFQGRLDEAFRGLGEALDLLSDLDAPHDRPYALQGLAELAMARSDLSTARAHLVEAVELVIQADEQVELARCLERIGHVLALAGEHGSAARVWASAARLRAESGAPIYPLDQTWYEPAVAEVRRVLGDELFDRSWAAGAVADPRTVAGEQAWWADSPVAPGLSGDLGKVSS